MKAPESVFDKISVGDNISSDICSDYRIFQNFKVVFKSNENGYFIAEKKSGTPVIFHKEYYDEYDIKLIKV